jgi:hypothetical protein
MYKVHWIIDGIAEIEADSKEEAEKKLQESLEEYVKNSKDLMNKYVARTIQGTAFKPGSDENEDKSNDDENKPSGDETNS